MVQGGGSSCQPRWVLCICKREHVRCLRIFIGPFPHQTSVDDDEGGFSRDCCPQKGKLGVLTLAELAREKKKQEEKERRKLIACNARTRTLLRSGL